jgi:hypothetical protein
MKSALLFAAIGIVLSLSSHAVESLETPLIGAQVFIEPGRTPEQIESWFAMLEKLMPSVIFADHAGRVDGSTMTIHPEETLVIRWELWPR